MLAFEFKYCINQATDITGPDLPMFSSRAHLVGYHTNHHCMRPIHNFLPQFPPILNSKTPEILRTGKKTSTDSLLSCTNGNVHCKVKVLDG